jgi:ArsR family transcriptional regulator, arsenate/arsenite/antimonite-responsive transcriptional repressor
MATNDECCDGGAGRRPEQLSGSRRLAQRFYALGDEIRLEVLGLLRGGERCVCELTAHLALAQSRLSFHLKVLKDAGLVSHRREGRWSYYALDAEALRELEAFLGRVPASAGPCCQALEPADAEIPRMRKEQR